MNLGEINLCITGHIKNLQNELIEKLEYLKTLKILPKRIITAMLISIARY